VTSPTCDLAIAKSRIVQVIHKKTNPSNLIQRSLIMENNQAENNISNASNRLKCPSCNSLNIEEIHYGKVMGRNVGTMVGGVTGVTGVLSGAEIGAGVGAIAGPAGIALGGLMGALFGGIVGAAAGRTIGENIGEVVDDNFLDNLHCLKCDHTFRKE